MDHDRQIVDLNDAWKARWEEERDRARSVPAAHSPGSFIVWTLGLLAFVLATGWLLGLIDRIGQ